MWSGEFERADALLLVYLLSLDARECLAILPPRAELLGLLDLVLYLPRKVFLALLQHFHFVLQVSDRSARLVSAAAARRGCGRSHALLRTAKQVHKLRRRRSCSRENPRSRWDALRTRPLINPTLDAAHEETRHVTRAPQEGARGVVRCIVL